MPAIHQQSQACVCCVFVCFQADAGAQVVQIFDSWASHLSPQDFDVFSGPYIKKVRLRLASRGKLSRLAKHWHAMIMASL
jgi:uroporphyrinogen-III decarboxylase